MDSAMSKFEFSDQEVDSRVSAVDTGTQESRSLAMRETCMGSIRKTPYLACPDLISRTCFISVMLSNVIIRSRYGLVEIRFAGLNFV